MSDSDTPLPADWAIEEALRRLKEVLPYLKNERWNLCDVKRDVRLGWAQSIVLAARLIEAHEQSSIDPDIRLVADIINAFEDKSWVEEDIAMTHERHRESLMKAVAVYKGHRAKETPLD